MAASLVTAVARALAKAGPATWQVGPVAGGGVRVWCGPNLAPAVAVSLLAAKGPALPGSTAATLNYAPCRALARQAAVVTLCTLTATITVSPK